jgi:flavin reductase (DIM6/NTAB) family NADH-FMN oxidoreductase RutF
MSSFPTGVAVVTSTGADGSPRGVTCSSLSSVALDPPTLLVCLKTRGSTLDTVRTREWFAVNLLHARARTTAEVFSSPVADRFAHVRWRLTGTAGLPWLYEDALAVAECTLTGLYAVGDHTVVLGEVAGVELRPDVPLLYGMRQFSAWPAAPAGRTGPGPGSDS